MKKILKTVAFMLTFILMLSSCQESEQVSDKLNVYTSFYAMYDFASTIGGDDISLTSIVPTGSEPHDFEPTASLMAKLSECDVFIYNGGGMEIWAEKIINTLPESVDVVCLSEGLTVDGSDPHVWLSIDNAKIQMQTVCNAFINADNKNAEKYTDRLNEWQKRADELKAEYEAADLAGKSIFVTHGAYGYLCKDFGMEQNALEGISGESDPSPSQMAEIVDKIKSENAQCIYYDPLEGEKIANAIAKEAGVEARMLYTFEGDLQKRDYLSVMRYNLEQLVK